MEEKYDLSTNGYKSNIAYLVWGPNVYSNVVENVTSCYHMKCRLVSLPNICNSCIFSP